MFGNLTPHTCQVLADQVEVVTDVHSDDDLAAKRPCPFDAARTQFFRRADDNGFKVCGVKLLEIIEDVIANDVDPVVVGEKA